MTATRGEGWVTPNIAGLASRNKTLVRNNPKKKGTRERIFTAIDEDVLNAIVATQGRGDAYNFLVHRNLLLEDELARIEKDPRITNPVLSTILANSNNMWLDYALKRAKREAGSVHYNTGAIDFTDVQGLAYMGYTVDRSLIGQLYDSPISGVKPLRWIFEDLDLSMPAEDELLEVIACFGDVEIFRLIKKILSFDWSSKRLSYSRYKNFDNVDRLQYAECLLFVVAMNNPEMAQYINESCNNFSSLDFGAISKELFHLSEEDRLYYHSGTKFSTIKTLKRNASWGGLTGVPGGTLAAMSLHMSVNESVEALLGAHVKYNLDRLKPVR